MKKRLKVLSVLLAGCLILALAGCGGADTAGAGAEAPGSGEGPYERGSVSDGVYTNEFLKLGCEFGEDWTYASAEELDDFSGITPGTAKGMALSDLVEVSAKRGTTYSDLYATYADGLLLVTVAYDTVDIVDGQPIDGDAYVDRMMDEMRQYVDSGGYSDVLIEKTSLEIAGQSRPVAVLIAESLATPTYQKNVCYKHGDYMVNILLCSYYFDLTDDLAGMFYGLE